MSKKALITGVTGIAINLDAIRSTTSKAKMWKASRKIVFFPTQAMNLPGAVFSISLPNQMQSSAFGSLCADGKNTCGDKSVCIWNTLFQILPVRHDSRQG